MFTSLRKKFATIAASLALAFLPVFVPVAVHADVGNDIQDKLACGTNFEVGSGCDASTSGGTSRITGVARDLINIFSAIVGIVSVVMIIFGGWRYMTSGGDPGNVGNAKNTIIYAIVGLVVVAMAQFIVQFVLNKVSSAGQ